MKQANVVSVRASSPTDSCPARLGDHQKRQHIEALLRLYPNTSEAETKEIITFLARDSHLDVGLVAGSDEFREKVAAIRAEHKRHFRPRPHELAMFVALIGGPVAALFYHHLM